MELKRDVFRDWMYSESENEEGDVCTELVAWEIEQNDYPSHPNNVTASLIFGEGTTERLFLWFEAANTEQMAQVGQRLNEIRRHLDRFEKAFTSACESHPSFGRVGRDKG